MRDDATCKESDCFKPVRTRGWCNAHYLKYLRYGDPQFVGKYKTPQESFVARTMPVTETGCLIWTGSVRGPYGVMRAEGKTVSVHRFAWEQENGTIPDGMKIDHKNHCSTLCCNVNHLRLATNAQNLANRSGKEIRNTSGYRNVVWNRHYQMWQVVIMKDKVNNYFGIYDDIEEAARVAEEKRLELFGEFAGKGV